MLNFGASKPRVRGGPGPRAPRIRTWSWTCRGDPCTVSSNASWVTVTWGPNLLWIDRQTHTHDWKHYRSVTLLAGGEYKVPSVCLSVCLSVCPHFQWRHVVQGRSKCCLNTQRREGTGRRFYSIKEAKLAIGGSPSGSKFFHFHVVFGKKIAKW